MHLKMIAIKFQFINWIFTGVEIYTIYIVVERNNLKIVHETLELWKNKIEAIKPHLYRGNVFNFCYSIKYLGVSLYFFIAHKTCYMVKSKSL